LNFSDDIKEGYAEREVVVRSFFTSEAGRLAELCHRVAERFARGGRLLAFGAGAAATDAQHVSVEFVHPVIVGKRALPALALPNDAGSTLSLALGEGDSFFARQLEVVGASGDIALGMVHSEEDVGLPAVQSALRHARSKGMLTIALSGPGFASEAPDYWFAVDSDDPFIVQEVHETLYHVLWELVHVFFDQKGLLQQRDKGETHDSGASSFLYPFLSEGQSDLEEVLLGVERSIIQKAEDVIALRSGSLDADGLSETARLISERVAAGGKVLAFGNGGSATDAQDLVVDLMVPPNGLQPIPAMSLTNDAAVVTAVANDVGFENIYSRQLIAYGNENDIAFAISTSGGSRNVLAAVEEASKRGLLTVALAGYGGGRLAEMCHRSHTVGGDYIPRIQEAQATQYHSLRRLL